MTITIPTGPNHECSPRRRRSLKCSLRDAARFEDPPDVGHSVGPQQRPLQNTILAAITTNISRSAEPTQVEIDVSSAAGQQSGLLNDSVVSCENLITARQSQVIRAIGNVPPDVMQQVDGALKASLDIS